MTSTSGVTPGVILEEKEIGPGDTIAAPRGSVTYRVSYGSENARGDVVEMTGLVTLPKGEKPAAGWPVLSWAHGTTGISRSSAPSLSASDHPNVEPLTMVVDEVLQKWVDDGWAVVQPDYEGLGTTGHGTYMNRPALSAAVNRLVEAATERFGFAQQWVNTGWSQGGFAAVGAASTDNVPEGLVGTFAIAPGDTGINGFGHEGVEKFAVEGLRSLDASKMPFTMLALRGAMNANPKLAPEDILSAKGLEMAEQAMQEPLETLKALFTVGGDAAIAENPSPMEIMGFLDAMSLRYANPVGPVYLFISPDDDVIDYEQIRETCNQLEANDKVDATVLEFPGKLHRPMVPAAYPKIREVVDSLI